MSSVFQFVRNLKPGKSKFDLSYEKLFTCDMGQLIPVMCEEVIPGDIIKVGCSSVIRAMPLVAPVLHRIDVYYHVFLVPYRLLDDNWETFITKGEDGEQTPSLTEWTVPGARITAGDKDLLWDYFAMPMVADMAEPYPLAFPRTAYNLIYNEFYRDENNIDEVLLTNEHLLNRGWTKDYFTSALPWQQRGTAGALPITGTTSAVWPETKFDVASGLSVVQTYGLSGDPRFFSDSAQGSANLRGALNSNTVDLSSASTFDVADLRLAFQVQKWQERNARGGVRYVEFLKAHFGENPRDDRLQRPEYIGGYKSPVIVSEVLQTSETGTTPQGNLAGHALGVGQGFCGKVHVQEFGLIMGIMSIMPKPVYSSQGIQRQWLRKTPFEFPFPEFCNLSEQAIKNTELYSTNVELDNETIFGYQGRYDELRVKQNMIVGEMRDTYDYWHIARKFASAPELDSTFINCVPRKDIFADSADPGFLVNWGNLITAYRPIPVLAEPGLIDHN